MSKNIKMLKYDIMYAKFVSSRNRERQECHRYQIHRTGTQYTFHCLVIKKKLLG